jgi:hypothetical protein
MAEPDLEVLETQLIRLRDIIREGETPSETKAAEGL